MMVGRCVAARMMAGCGRSGDKVDGCQPVDQPAPQPGDVLSYYYRVARMHTW